jgi:hypothetical protein
MYANCISEKDENKMNKRMVYANWSNEPALSKKRR